MKFETIYVHMGDVRDILHDNRLAKGGDGMFESVTPWPEKAMARYRWLDECLLLTRRPRAFL